MIDKCFLFAGSNKYLKYLFSHYFFLIALESKNPYMFLKGIIKSPEYFLKITFFTIKKIYNR